MNRSQKRKQAKVKGKQFETVNAPYIKLCEAFASDYLTLITQGETDFTEVIDTYDKDWRNRARKIIEMNPGTYKTHKDHAKNRTNLMNAFKTFSNKFLDKQSRGEIKFENKEDNS